MSPVLLLALTACGVQESAGSSETAAAVEDDGRIECRIGGAAQFERFCTVERDGADLTVRKPDGGFRRLRIVGDGRGVEAADGAEGAVVTLLSDRRIEVAIGGDAFRLPATVQSR
ncbi:hypothetical protein RCO27_03275 [Sphingosinicella sp. LHD-64]|uniref:hypothetical protein n=1 Tax=Sphingosinicella sp. LHD-64 TaxID=3072139 RepID=UPI00280D6B9E|nr:hypothetical protein [Sphingosinicella sp. LHD-64]MDQ8755243.1 hypothetical protein [Sphingosinicella sp. LHD-64]